MEHYRVDTTNQTDESSINWEMDEYLHRKRGLFWYVGLVGLAISLSWLGFWLTDGEVIVPISIVSMVAILLIFSLKRPSRQIYSLNQEGVHIGSEFYDYNHFKNFSLFEEDNLIIVQLFINQRFKPAINLNLPSNQKGDEILDILAEHIIYTPRNTSVLDRLLHILKF